MERVGVVGDVGAGTVVIGWVDPPSYFTGLNILAA